MRNGISKTHELIICAILAPFLSASLAVKANYLRQLDISGEVAAAKIIRLDNKYESGIGSLFFPNNKHKILLGGKEITLEFQKQYPSQTVNIKFLDLPKRLDETKRAIVLNEKNQYSLLDLIGGWSKVILYGGVCILTIGAWSIVIYAAASLSIKHLREEKHGD